MAKTTFSNTLVTKALVLQAIEAMINDPETGFIPEQEAYDSNGVSVLYSDILEYCAVTRAQLAEKADKAKAKAAEKKAAGNELRERVKAVLTEEPQTRDEVFANFAEEEGITIAKIGARLTQLVKAGEVEKSQEKIADGTKKMTYKLAQ